MVRLLIYFLGFLDMGGAVPNMIAKIFLGGGMRWD